MELLPRKWRVKRDQDKAHELERLLPWTWQAHTVLLATSPAAGTRLEASPAEVTLRFNEPVRPIAVRVLDATGTVVTAPDAVAAADDTVQVDLPTSLTPGSYLIPRPTVR